jgi:hypothetical protein
MTYQPITITCQKCGRQIRIETDFLTESQAIKLHVCEVKKCKSADS